MPKAHPGSMWFPREMKLEEQYQHYVNWGLIRAELESKFHETTIGWVWLQRRGTKKWTHGRLSKCLGDDIEVYRKPSVATRYDLTPPELIGWAKPVERNLSQLNLTRKDLGENPLWDVWVRIKPPGKSSILQDRRADKYIKDKGAQDAVEKKMRDLIERMRKMSPIEKELTEADSMAPWQREKLEAEYDQWKRNRLVLARRNHREYREKDADRYNRLRREALAIHAARIEAGRLRTAHMRNDRKGK